MTKAVFKLPRPAGGDVRLVPLLAVGEASGGVLTPQDVADMVSDPDSYCDAEQDKIVSAHKIRRDLTLQPLSRDGLKKLIDGASPELLAEIVVDADALSEVFLHVQRERRNYPDVQLTSQEALGTWDWHAHLPVAHAAAIRAALPKSLFPTRKGAAGRADVEKRLQDAMATIQARAARAGRPIDTSALPGTTGPFTRLIKAIDPEVDRAESTLKDHYKRIGWRWRQGARPEEAGWLVELFKDLLPVR